MDNPNPAGRHLKAPDTAKTLFEVRHALIFGAMQYAEACGLSPTDSGRFVDIFSGDRPPCRLKTGELYITEIYSAARSKGIFLDPLAGSYQVQPTGRSGYEITIRKEENPLGFLICRQESGDGDLVQGATLFPSFSLLYPQVVVTPEEAVQLALVIHLRGYNDGTSVELDYNWADYNRAINDPTAPGGKKAQRRLDGLKPLLSSGDLLQIADAAGMPWRSIRVNRASREERAGRSTETATPRWRAPSRAPVGAGVPHRGDPFRDD